MSEKTFTCPKCGGTLAYKGNQDILQCPYCGAAVEREGTIVDKVIRYKERKAENDLTEKKRLEKKQEEGLKSLRIMFIAVVVIFLIMYFMKR